MNPDRGASHGLLDPLPDATPVTTSLGQKLLSLLRPAILSRSTPRKPLHRTAYLDGLRGFAAFLVYWHHYQLSIHSEGGAIIKNGFGWEGKYYLAAFPFVRLFVTGGHFAVAIFFVISGYVLSTKALGLIHAGEHARVLETLSSSLFRRWMRLFMPVAITTFSYIALRHIFGYRVFGEDNPKSFLEDAAEWYKDFKRFSFIFEKGGLPFLGYHFYTWSIPAEFRGSVVIFTSLLAFSLCTRNARLVLHAGLILYFLFVVNGAQFANFSAGVLLADLDLLTLEGNLPAVPYLHVSKGFRKLLLFAMLMFGLYLGGIPHDESGFETVRNTPGWYYLSFLKPSIADHLWYYLFFSAVCTVICAQHIPIFKSFLESTFCQYLGRISFSLYLVHIPIIWAFGLKVMAATGWTGIVEAPWIENWNNRFPLTRGWVLCAEPSFLLPHVVLLPFTLWVAEVTTKCADEPSLQFAHWCLRKAKGVK